MNGNTKYNCVTCSGAVQPFLSYIVLDSLVYISNRDICKVCDACHSLEDRNINVIT